MLINSRVYYLGNLDVITIHFIYFFVNNCDLFSLLLWVIDCVNCAHSPTKSQYGRAIYLCVYVSAGATPRGYAAHVRMRLTVREKNLRYAGIGDSHY